MSEICMLWGNANAEDSYVINYLYATSVNEKIRAGSIGAQGVNAGFTSIIPKLPTNRPVIDKVQRKLDWAMMGIIKRCK